MSERDDEAAFVAHCRERMPVQCRSAILIACAFGVAWWPTDPFVFHGLPGAVHAFAVERAMILGGAALYFASVWKGPLRRIALVPFLVCLCGGAAFTAGMLARLGGPDSPWLSFIYILPFPTVMLPLRLRGRIAATLLIAAASVAGGFALHPAYLASAYAPMTLSFMVCAVVSSVLAGNSVFKRLRENFLQSLALERATVHLEETVARKTQELRRLLAHRETAREDERANLSRELHDELGQELTALRYALAFTRKRYGQEAAAIGPHLADLEELLGRTSSTVRTIVTGLRPRVLDDLGLRAALEWLVRRAGERTGAECTLAVEGDDGALAGELPLAVFRVAQESLTNAARHAAAKRIEVALRVGAGDLELRVRDDGRGFDPAAPPRPSAAGLIGMRERADALGGALSVETRPGDGTAVVLRLPLAAAEARA